MLYIVTPWRRPQNLKLIKPTIPGPATWVVLFDKTVKGFFYSPADVSIYSMRYGSVDAIDEDLCYYNYLK